MKTIRFTYSAQNGGYKCSEPGDQDGEYVKAGSAEFADWYPVAMQIVKKYHPDDMGLANFLASALQCAANGVDPENCFEQASSCWRETSIRISRNIHKRILELEGVVPSSEQATQ